jgi:hypothetical protein
MAPGDKLPGGLRLRDASLGSSHKRRAQLKRNLITTQELQQDTNPILPRDASVEQGLIALERPLANEDVITVLEAVEELPAGQGNIMHSSAKGGDKGLGDTSRFPAETHKAVNVGHVGEHRQPNRLQFGTDEHVPGEVRSNMPGPWIDRVDPQTGVEDIKAAGEQEPPGNLFLVRLGP